MAAEAPADLARELEACLAGHATPEALSWLSAGARGPTGAFARATFFGRYAGALRRFPGAFAPEPAFAERLLALGVGVNERIECAELARVALLLRALSALPSSEWVPLATEVFRRGDTGERVALLRALPLLPDDGRFVELAIEACRTQVLDVFAAIACENGFPARHFPELNFNQLLIKALFLELRLSRVLGWRPRANAELRRIAADYEAERRAAGRSVPADIATIKATEPAP